MDDEHAQARFWNYHDIAERISQRVKYVLGTATGVYARVVGGLTEQEEEAKQPDTAADPTTSEPPTQEQQ